MYVDNPNPKTAVTPAILSRDFIALYRSVRLCSCTLRLCRVIAKFHYTDTDTDTDFFAAKLRWVRVGPFGSVSVSV